MEQTKKFMSKNVPTVRNEFIKSILIKWRQKKVNTI